MATQERLRCSILSFQTSLRLPKVITPGERPRPLVSYAFCQGMIVFFNSSMAEARDFHCSSHVVENLGKKTIPSDHAAIRLVIRNLLVEDSRTNVFPSWMSKNLIFGSVLQQLHDDHRFSPDPFCALAEFKVLLHKALEITNRELSRQTNT